MEDSSCCLCGSAQAHLVYLVPERLLEKDVFRVVRCKKCGLFWVSPRPTPQEILFHYPENYPDYQFIYPDPFMPQRTNFLGRVKDSLKRYLLCIHYGYFAKGNNRSISIFQGLLRWWTIPLKYRLGWIFPPWVDNRRVLDVGCSTGIYLSILRELGWEVYGVEPNEQAAAWARNQLGFKVSWGYLEQAAFADNFFDVVTFWHSLEHTENPIYTLQEAFRILKPGGILLVGIPNTRSLDRLLFGFQAFQWDVPRHLTHFTPRTIRQALEIAGFIFPKIEFPICPYNLILSASYWFQDHFPRWQGQFRYWLHPDKSYLARQFGWLIGIPLSILRITDRMNVTARKPKPH